MAEEADTSIDDNLDDAYCSLVYIFQKELGLTIDGEYSVARFMVLLDELQKESKRNKKDMEKSKNG